MIVAIAANVEQKYALKQKSAKDGVEIRWVLSSAEVYKQAAADVWIDCMFSGTSILPHGKPLIIHSPINTLLEINAGARVARFCAWSGFTERDLWEMAVTNSNDIYWLQEIMDALGWRYVRVKDEPGFIAPRIISMIVNEAYFALSESLSSRAEINTAMKLGTNYPFGPFEWADKMGLKNIYALLQKLSETDQRYKPCEEMRPEDSREKTMS